MRGELFAEKSAIKASKDSISATIQSCYSAAQAALLVRLRSVDRAEDAMQDAVLKALQHWQHGGIPIQPVAWLVTSGLNSFRDHYRKDSRMDPLMETTADGLNLGDGIEQVLLAAENNPDDDVLRLIFMCCHPSLAVPNQLVLSLKMLMGFSLQEIAKALLIPVKTLEQRITRAKRKISVSGISFELPTTKLLPLRLDSVRQILYLIFNEGYHSVGEELINRQLCRQAILLARSLCRGFPEPENFGLLALMLFHDARANARVDDSGELITLDSQNRMLWKRSQINEADVLLQKALRNGRIGSYQLQAAIAGVHSLAASAAETDWHEIVGLYRRLLQQQSGPVIALNYAVALMMAERLQEAGRLLDSLQQDLQNYSPYYAALAKFHVLSGKDDKAAAALQKAASVTGSTQEKRHYQLQLAEIEKGSG